MNEVLGFQRARKPAEQKLRRDAILNAAAELFDHEGARGTGLNAIAARAGFTKSNVYRYFESREEVLLSLFLDELERFAAEFEAAIAARPPGDIDAMAEAGADGFLAHPRFCALIAILAGVLEQNVSVDKIVDLKRGVLELNRRIASSIAGRLPGASLEDCGWVVSMTATIVAGMWPNVTPSAAAGQVLAMPEFAHLKPAPQRDLKRAIAALLASIA